MPNKQTGPWLIVPESPHAAMRCVLGTDPAVVANRVAFIEKTPRVRVAPFSGTLLTDGVNWKGGAKGAGGPDGDNPVNQLYGFYPPAREWCDRELQAMGYTLTN